MLDFQDYLLERRNRINQALDRCLPAIDIQPKLLHQAMRYAVLNGGKRVRPLLVYMVGEALGVSLEMLDMPACAIELIHAFSLVHDDLPAMDDDDLRRGVPTCHKKFNEATAILAGDALLVLALQLLSANDLDAVIQAKMVLAVTEAAGSLGMAGGQAIDISESKLNVNQLEQMYILKTGALLSASVQLGALVAGAHEILPLLIEYAHKLGLAFQIQDDLFDLGEEKKITYPALVGIKQAQQKVDELFTEILTILRQIPQNHYLLEFTRQIMQRKN